MISNLVNVTPGKLLAVLAALVATLAVTSSAPYIQGPPPPHYGAGAAVGGGVDPAMMMMVMMMADRSSNMMMPMMMMMLDQQSGALDSNMLMLMVMMQMMDKSSSSKDDEYHWCYIHDSCAANTWPDHFPDCKGQKQSPINIQTGLGQNYAMPLPSPSRLLFSNYNGGPGQPLPMDKMVNNGHTVQLTPAALNQYQALLSQGPLPLNSAYQLLQLHFHWGGEDSRGSEHTIDGAEFPLELHLVHKRKDLNVSEALATPDGLAVAGFFFEIDANDNAALKPLTDDLSQVVAKDSSVSVSRQFSISELISPVAFPVSHYSTYSGSLTTPTCNEVVFWINFLTPLKISSDQIAEFRKLKDGKGNYVIDNYRPPQPLNGRTVTHFNANVAL